MLSRSESEDCGGAVVDWLLQTVATTPTEKESRDCRICHLPFEKMVLMNKKKKKKKQEKVKVKMKKKKKSNWVAFKIGLLLTCEICGAMAKNVAGEQSNQESNASAHSQTTAGQTQTEIRGTWHGRCVMNFLLAAMIFAFIVTCFFFRTPR
ncbi:unnamed protein product [Brassica oleracea]|uniref:(rape) hypothetical protein n=1 Tax=Brassica napus TaxID=3708 RepID=A0A816K5F9_BRANA|nr:unnamed protein product [Brassica napus]